MNNNDKIYKIAKTQVDFVKSVLGKRFSFEDNNTNETNGGYTTYGTLETPTALIIVRVSNHICSMDNWTQRYKTKRIANKKLARRMGNNLQTPYKDRCFFSVVFKAFDYQPNDVGSWRAICNEYTFDPLEIEENGSLGNIAQDCLKLNSNKSVSINGQAPTQRIAQKGNTIENNQQTNENKTMNKRQVIRLNENQLKQIINESLNRILNEYKNAETKFYNDMVNNYLENGYDLEDAKAKARVDVRKKGLEKNRQRNYIPDRTEEEIAIDRAISNFMDDKDDAWRAKLPNYGIYTMHRKDENGHEWDEEFAQELGYRPTRDVFKKYFKKHNKAMDMRHGNERR